MFLNWIAIIISKENINWIQKWRYGFKQFYVHIKNISTLTAVIWNLVTYCILTVSLSTPSSGISTWTFYRFFLSSRIHCRAQPSGLGVLDDVQLCYSTTLCRMDASSLLFDFVCFRQKERKKRQQMSLCVVMEYRVSGNESLAVREGRDFTTKAWMACLFKVKFTISIFERKLLHQSPENINKETSELIAV